jgi:photosystem II stability/assembly factor-like uncharacterized protein
MTYQRLLVVGALAVAMSIAALAVGWERLDGPFGVAVYDLVEAANGDLLLACDQGVYRFDEDDDWWRPAGLVGTKMRTLFTASDGVVWAGGFGIWRSLDDGETWQEASEGLGTVGTLVHGFAERGSTVLAATEVGLLARDHDGDEWQIVYPESTVALGNLGPTRAVAVDAGGAILIGIGRYVLRSTDGGEDWTDSLILNSLVTSIAIGPDGLVLVGAADTGVELFSVESGEVHLSTDGGVSFTRADGYGGDGQLPVNDVGEVAITEDSVLYVGGFRESGWSEGKGGGLWRSNDLGETWEGTLFYQLDVRTIEFLADGALWVGSDTGPYRPFQGSGIGIEWAAHGLPIRDAPIRGVFWSFIRGLFAWADGHLMQVLSTDGASWGFFGPGNNYIRSVAESPDGGLAAVARGGVYGAPAPGAGAFSFSGDPIWELDSFQPTMVAGDPSATSGILCVAEPRVTRCRVEGWWNVARFDGWLISGLVSHRSNAVFAALESEVLDQAHRVIRSADGFQTWETVWEPTSPIRVASLIADRDGRLYAVLADGSFAASDVDGSDWRRRGELEPAPVAIAVNEQSRLFAAYSDLVLQSANGGWSWSVFGDRLAGVEITSIAAGDGGVYLGTTDGVFMRRVSDEPRSRPGKRRVD